MPRAKRDLSVKTPGVTAPDGEPDPEGDAAAVEAAVADTSDVDSPPPADMPDDLKAYIASEVAKGIAKGMKQIKAAQVNPAAPAVVLPDQKEIDASKIDKPVLTKQGYVVPHALGSAPQHIRQQIALGAGVGINKQH